MRFSLIDRITHLEPGHSITAVKNLSLAEEYLADHFPAFPVMPGVLMLEAMVQAGAWLMRASDDFAHSTILLKEARNVKFGSFVEPGRQLVVTARLLGQDAGEAKLSATGSVDGEQAVSGRLVLERFNLAQRDPDLRRIDEALIEHLREMFSSLYRTASTDVVSSQAGDASPDQATEATASEARG